MISSGWKINEIEYVKVRLKWWHLRKTNVVNITMASNTGILYVPNVLPDKVQTQDAATDDFMEVLYKAMREPVKDTPTYVIGHCYPPTDDDQAFLNELVKSWHTPPMSASEREAAYAMGTWFTNPNDGAHTTGS